MPTGMQIDTYMGETNVHSYREVVTAVTETNTNNINNSLNKYVN